MSKQSTVELQVEFLDPTRPTNPFVGGLQVATSAFSPYFLMKLVNSNGKWKSIVRSGFQKARGRGESPLDRVYSLSGNWSKIKVFSEKIGLEELRLQGGLQGLMGKAEPGLYCLLQPRQLKKHSLPPMSYYEVLWSVLLLSEDGYCKDPSDEVAAILRTKPKINFEENLYRTS